MTDKSSSQKNSSEKKILSNDTSGSVATEASSNTSPVNISFSSSMGDYKGLLQKLELKNRTVKVFELTIPLVGSRAYDLDQQTVSSSSKSC